MFEIKVENCGNFKTIVDMLDKLINEALIIVEKNQFRILAMDPSRIAIFRLILEKKSFIKYDVKEPTTIGISFNDLNKILTRIEADNSLELSFDGKDNLLQVIAKKKDIGRKRTFKITTVDVEYTEEDIDFTKLFAHEYLSTMLFDSDNFYLFSDAIKDGLIYSEKLDIITTPKLIKFVSRGQVGEMEYELTPDEITDYELGKCNTSFSLTYLSKIIKLHSVGKLIEFNIDINYPLKVDFELIDGGSIVILVGPLVDQEDADDFDDDINMEY